MEHDQDKLKQSVGKAAVDELVKSGMKLGLGTGSTAIHAVRRVGELLAKGELKDITAFATSFQTEIECEKLNIPHYSLNSSQLESGLDLTIDGADEVDSSNRLIKGGGGAMLIEKLAAYSSKTFAVIVDESKIVEYLAIKFPIPVEVIPEARVQAVKALEKLSATVIIREALRKAGPVITEHGNIILDIRFNMPYDLNECLPPLNYVALEKEINTIPGVVENGLFTQKDPIVYIAQANGEIDIRIGA